MFTQKVIIFYSQGRGGLIVPVDNFPDPEKVEAEDFDFFMFGFRRPVPATLPDGRVLPTWSFENQPMKRFFPNATLIPHEDGDKIVSCNGSSYLRKEGDTLIQKALPAPVKNSA